jgi:hypothetical protein
MTDDTNVTMQPQAAINEAVLFGGPDEPEPAPAPTESPQVSELKGQLAQLTKQIEQMQQANMTLMMRPEAPVPMHQQAAPAPGPQVAPLPDPLDDAEGYANALADRISQQIAAKQEMASAQQRSQTDSAAKYNELWENFQITHKDYAKDFRQVKYAANIAAENIAKRGIDVERYMFTYRDQFMADVVEVMDDVFGKKDMRPAPPSTQDIDRSGGMFGGTPAAVPRTDNPAPGDEANAFDDIRKWQEKSGFHR